MKTKSFISYMLHPFLTLLCLALLAMILVFSLEDKAASLLSFSFEDSIAIFLFGMLFMVYPVLTLCFALPALMMDYFKLNARVRIFMFLMLGIVCASFDTILNPYRLLYVGIAIIFSLIDFSLIAVQKKSNKAAA